MSRSETRYVVIVRAHSAVGGIPYHDEKSRRFCRAVVATAGNPGSTYPRDHAVLAIQAAQAYHSPPTRSYYMSGGRSSDQPNVISARELYLKMYISDFKDRTHG